MTSVYDKAIAILQATEDGNELAPEHLSLLQLVVNNDGDEAADVAFDALYDQVMASSYKVSKPCLFGIEHLTRDHEGYVYWKGEHVEHYSHSDPDDMKAAAEQLAQKCLALEAKGFPVNGRTAMSDAILDAPADTPWLEALMKFYTFFANEERVVPIFYCATGNLRAVALEKSADGEITRQYFDDGYTAYHSVATLGLASNAPYESYDQVRELLERSRLTPEEIHDAIA